MIAAMPSAGDIRIATRTTTGTLLTLDANRVFCGEIVISGNVTGLGTATPNVVMTGAGAGMEPATGTTVHQISVSGALSLVGNNSDRIEVVLRPGTANATLTFNTGGAGAASCTISGFYL